MSKQPEALIAAEYLQTIESPCAQMGAAELRRLHAANVDLLEALKVTRAELFQKIWNQHDAQFASQYPEIVLADAAIAKHGSTS